MERLTDEEFCKIKARYTGRDTLYRDIGIGTLSDILKLFGCVDHLLVENSRMKADIKIAAKNEKILIRSTELLEARVKKLKAERDKAVEDMSVMALAMRESEEMSEGCCFACICENLPDNCILPYGECPGYDKDDCFKWCGLEGSGE